MDETKEKAEEYFHKAKDWFQDNGVGKLLLGASGFALAGSMTMQLASTWMGGGTLSAILAVPIAFTAGLGGAVLLPGVTNSLWETAKSFFSDSTDNAPAQQQTPAVEAVAPKAEVAEHELGEITPSATPEQKVSPVAPVVVPSR